MKFEVIEPPKRPDAVILVDQIHATHPELPELGGTSFWIGVPYEDEGQWYCESHVEGWAQTKWRGESPMEALAHSIWAVHTNLEAFVHLGYTLRLLKHPELTDGSDVLACLFGYGMYDKDGQKLKPELSTSVKIIPPTVRPPALIVEDALYATHPDQTGDGHTPFWIGLPSQEGQLWYCESHVAGYHRPKWHGETPMEALANTIASVHGNIETLMHRGYKLHLPKHPDLQDGSEVLKCLFGYGARGIDDQ